MGEPLLVVLLGVGITALGLVQPDFYEIGIVVVLVGGVGMAVRAGEWLRRRTRA